MELEGTAMEVWGEEENVDGPGVCGLSRPTVAVGTKSVSTKGGGAGIERDTVAGVVRSIRSIEGGIGIAGGLLKAVPCVAAVPCNKTEEGEANDGEEEEDPTRGETRVGW